MSNYIVFHNLLVLEQTQTGQPLVNSVLLNFCAYLLHVFTQNSKGFAKNMFLSSLVCLISYIYLKCVVLI